LEVENYHLFWEYWAISHQTIPGMRVMENSQRILQSVKFIGAWTVLWPVVGGFCLLTLHMAAKTSDPQVWQQVGFAIFYGVLLSLVGSIIGYALMYCLDRLRRKRLILSLFWGVFWIIPLLSASPSGGQNQNFDWGWRAIMLIPMLLFVAPAIAGIAWLVSFEPILCPKSYRD
jgi:hypothetical protein